MATALVQMKNISKSYGRVHALENVHLTVNEREIVGLLGDNGLIRVVGDGHLAGRGSLGQGLGLARRYVAIFDDEHVAPNADELG